ncbi:unnamed protein product, partial [marine sediment metagenome]
MTKAEVLKFLTETEEGKGLLEELKKPLLTKRDELLAQIKNLGEKTTSVSQREADANRLLLDEREAINKMAIDDRLEVEFRRLEIPSTHWVALSAHIKAHNEIEVKANGPLRVAEIKGQKLSDFLDTWSKTDEAKALIPAPAAHG